MGKDNKNIDNEIKAENIKNSNEIKSSADFSWGGDALMWEERAFDVASTFSSFNWEKKYSLNKSDKEKMIQKMEASRSENAED